MLWWKYLAFVCLAIVLIGLMVLRQQSLQPIRWEWWTYHHEYRWADEGQPYSVTWWQHRQGDEFSTGAACVAMMRAAMPAYTQCLSDERIVREGRRASMVDQIRGFWGGMSPEETARLVIPQGVKPGEAR